MKKYDPVDHETRAVKRMADQILEEEDARALEKLDEFAKYLCDMESLTTKLTRMGEQTIRVDSILMSKESYEDIVRGALGTSMSFSTSDIRALTDAMAEAERDRANLDIANSVADEIRAARVSPYSMGAIVSDPACPDCELCEPLTSEQRDAIIRLGRQSGKTEMATEFMRQQMEASMLSVGRTIRLSDTGDWEVVPQRQNDGGRSTAVAAAFQANYGPEKLDLKVLRAAAESLHDMSVPLDEAKRRMMEAMENLTPAEIPLVQRELQRALAENGPARPVNRAQRRQVAKARRRA